MSCIKADLTSKIVIMCQDSIIVFPKQPANFRSRPSVADLNGKHVHYKTK